MSVAVSVCIPVYNRKDMVLAAVQSALNQDVDGLEVVVVDNCSEDGTWDILQTITDDRVRIFRNPTNIGMINNFSQSCNLARGEFLLMLCSDDRLCPGFLKEAIKLMRANPRVTLLNSVGRLIDKDGATLGRTGNRIAAGIYEGRYARRTFFEFTGMYRASIFNYPAGIVMRGSSYRKAAPFRVELGDPADADMYIRCLEDGDMLMTDYVGCEIVRHFDQRGQESFRVGRYFDELLQMADAHLSAPEDAVVKRRFRRLLGGIALPWALAALKHGDATAWQKARGLGWAPMGMAGAYVQRLVYRILAKLGYVKVPGLVKAQATE